MTAAQYRHQAEALMHLAYATLALAEAMTDLIASLRSSLVEPATDPQRDPVPYLDYLPDLSDVGEHPPLRDTFARFTAPHLPLVGRLAAGTLTVSWGDDDDGGDIVVLANTAVIPSQTLLELTPMDAVDIGAQLVVSGHEAIDSQLWGQ